MSAAVKPSTNGHAARDPVEIREGLRKQIREAIVAGRPKAARRLLESFWLWDGFGGSDLLDRLRPRTNSDASGEWLAPPSVPSDRRHGADWWVWRTQQELDYLRQESRLRHAQNSYAQGLLKNLTNNVIGKGYTYEAKALGDDGKPVPTEKMTPGQRSECLAVQRVVNRFLRLNNWNGASVDPHATDAVTATRERELFRTQKIDGEVFGRFHRNEQTGDVIFRLVDAAQVREGGEYVVQDGWTYGIQHQMTPYEDVCRYLSYAVFWPDPSAKGGLAGGVDKGNYEVIESEEMIHLRGPDCPSNVKRSLGIFLFGLGRALDRADKLQTNASIGASVRAAIASTEQWRQATTTQIQSMADALASRQYTDGRGRTVDVERIRPGTIRRVPEGFEQAPAAEDNTASFLTAVQGDLQEAGAGVCAPAYWFGDTGDVNYNNAESAAAPAVRDGQTEQEYWKSAFALCVWKAVLWAVECGKLNKGVEDRIALFVEAPAVLHRNELEKAQEDQIGVTMGWKDRQTCCAERGGDYATVEANNQEYNDNNNPGQPLDDGEGGAFGDPPVNRPKVPVAPKVATLAVAESVRFVAEKMG